ncbi:hypothetical protein ACIHBQ_31225 [Streptomyces sp. NPDC052492]|uniref:hypothetical protein n=1 Tax=unclassified Streptomyces TaxID=2593676 RepID=UPI0037CE0F72
MEAVKSKERAGRPARAVEPPAGQLVRLLAAGCCVRPQPAGAGAVTCGCAGHGLDRAAAMELVAAWHRRGTEVGFPELMARPARRVTGTR